MPELCPCGSNKAYELCCKPYISGAELAPTAESLMRARYAAYVKHEIDFIESTHSVKQRDSLSVEETKKWAESSTWHGLTILGTDKGGPEDKKGTVTFIARYSRDGQRHEHRETSQFERIDNKWYFKDGDVDEGTVVRDGEKTGRNDPCPCGSGKKFKHCHGK